MLFGQLGCRIPKTLERFISKHRFQKSSAYSKSEEQTKRALVVKVKIKSADNDSCPPPSLLVYLKLPRKSAQRFSDHVCVVTVSQVWLRKTLHLSVWLSNVTSLAQSDRLTDRAQDLTQQWPWIKHENIKIFSPNIKTVKLYNSNSFLVMLTQIIKEYKSCKYFH